MRGRLRTAWEGKTEESVDWPCGLCSVFMENLRVSRDGEMIERGKSRDEL
ncbi:hypothetical protein COLO4_08931 [Corchorus olitorius]|uniref:Uncharacterized protein n=1 Tax=Corchorus olitorius TaxID=93759 RepID=A0A1R3KE63_9ROSI|nr:hypothetical protein COLO4_08931 [Corchorus olitorius]